MDISPLEARLVALSDLKNFKFEIPAFQRFYAWQRPQWTALTADLLSTSEDRKQLFLGLLVVVRSGNVYQVIDGQQRLTSISLLLSAMGDPTITSKSPDGRMQTFITPQSPDDLWLAKLLDNEPTGDPARHSQKLMSEAHSYFSTIAKQLTLDHINSSQMIIYCASEMSGATSLFERVNLRGLKISTMELVKNRLFDWTSRILNAEIRASVEIDIKDRFASIFHRINPHPGEGQIDADSLLRTHWILFDEGYTKTTDFGDMLKEIDEYLKDALRNTIKEERDAAAANAIRHYTKSLDAISIYWRRVCSPRFCPTAHDRLTEALISFQRLKREANFTPILVAAIATWGENDNTTCFVEFIEILNFRQALKAENSNSKRTKKWKIAKDIFRGRSDMRVAIQKLFWNVCPWWNVTEANELEPDYGHNELQSSEFAETAFSDPNAYYKFSHIMKYFFWEYGRWLPTTKQWSETREDVTVLTNDQWERAFETIEIEHIFPQRPKDDEDRAVKSRIDEMKGFLNHWGNLTLLTKRDNSSLQNSIFREKLNAVLEKNSNLLFNKLLRNTEYRGNLSNDAWSPNNCKKRATRLLEFSDVRWGRSALKRYSLGNYIDA